MNFLTGGTEILEVIREHAVNFFSIDIKTYRFELVLNAARKLLFFINSHLVKATHNDTPIIVSTACVRICAEIAVCNLKNHDQPTPSVVPTDAASLNCKELNIFVI